MQQPSSPASSFWPLPASLKPPTQLPNQPDQFVFEVGNVESIVDPSLVPQPEEQETRYQRGNVDWFPEPLRFGQNCALAVARCLHILLACEEIEGRSLVLDIDGTSLKAGGGIAERLRPIEPIRIVYYFALYLGYRVYFVTARPERFWDTGSRQWITNFHTTEEHLAAMDYRIYHGIFHRSELYQGDPNYSWYKWQCRRHIEKKLGGFVVLNIGDNWEDMLLTEMYAQSPGHKLRWDRISQSPAAYQMRRQQQLRNGVPIEQIQKLSPPLTQKEIYLWQYPESHAMFGLKLPRET